MPDANSAMQLSEKVQDELVGRREGIKVDPG